MSEKNESHISAIEEALKLAVSTRELLTIKNGALENCLLGFFSVAQTLGRKDDMNWVENEINGYPSDKVLPKYRTGVFRRISADGEDLYPDPSFDKITFNDGILKTEHLLKAQLDYASALGKKSLAEAKRISPFSKDGYTRTTGTNRLRKNE